MLSLGKLGKKESDEDADKLAGEGGRAEGDAKEGGGLQRGGGKARFGAKAENSDSDSDDEGKKKAMQKKKEELAAKRAKAAAKQEKDEQHEIESAALGSTAEKGKAGSEGSSGDGGALNRKSDVALAKTSRFKDDNDTRENEEHSSTGQLLVRNPHKLPWLSVESRQKGEQQMYMTLAAANRREKTMEKARQQMRRQGLYVARERVLLPGNVERAIQRVRIRKECAAQLARGDDSASTSVAITHDKFSPEEERYLVSFDPLKERYCRPAMRYDPYLPYLQYEMLVPVTNIDSVFGPAQPSMLLDLEIRKLTFTDHPYFCEEDFLAAQLEELWRKYKHRAEMKWVDFYSQKIEALKAALDVVLKERELTSGAEPAGGGKADAAAKDSGKSEGRDEKGGQADSSGSLSMNSESELHAEIGRLRLQRAEEEYEDLSIVSSMIQTWQRIKDVRKTFVSTKLKLEFKKQQMDPGVDQTNRDAELEAEMAERRRNHRRKFEETEISYLERRARLETDIKRRKARIRELEDKIAEAKMAEESENEASDDDEEDGKPQKSTAAARREVKVVDRLQIDAEAERAELERAEKRLEKLKSEQPTPPKMDEETAREEILARQVRTKRPPGDPLFIPVLSDRTQRTETDSLPDSKAGVEEAKRRKKIKSLKLIMKISVNGHMLRNDDGQVREVKLQPRPGHDFSFTVNESVKLAATSSNPQIFLHICESVGPLMTTELASGRCCKRLYKNKSSNTDAKGATSLLVPVAEDAVTDDRGDPYVFQDSRADRAFEPPWYENRRHDEYTSASMITVCQQEGKHVRPSGLHHTTGQIFLKVSNLSALQIDDDTVAVSIDRAAAAAPQDDRDRGHKGPIMSVPKLKKMIQMNKLDPNDPRNRHLLDLLSANKEQESEGFVRFDSALDMLRLNGDDKNETIKFKDKGKEVLGNRWVGEQHLTRPAGIRHKMLMSRQKNPVLFSGVGWNPIPLIESEINDDDMLNKVYSIEFPDAEDLDGPSVDNKKVQKVMRFKQKVQEQVRKAKAKHGAKFKRSWTLEDVVNQPTLPVFGGADIIAAVVHLLRKRSTLRPELNAAKTPVSNPTNCSISITVERAHNLPRRRQEEGSTAAPGPLECLVQARFGQEVAETPVYTDNDPAWNARLRLKFEAPGNNWSPANLLKVSENLHLTIFDTKVWESSSNARGNAQSRNQEVEKRWLGSLQIPFTTLYTSGGAKGRIDGVFAIDCPPHIISYTNHSGPQKDSKKGKEAQRAGADNSALQHTKRPSLQLFVSLDPPLVQPGRSDDKLDNRTGCAVLDARIKAWIAECSAPHCRAAGREYEPLGRSLHKDWVLATRFVKAEAPPQPAYNTSLPVETQMLQLARFVGLIPFLDDFQLDGGNDEDVDPDSLDVWCTSSEFIDIMAGDWEEHATMLCNFFNHVFENQHPPLTEKEMSAYLVVGKAIPEGHTVYTMTIDRRSKDGSEKVEFWNASKGIKFSQNDPHCTLREVFYVVNGKNVWGNVQQTQELRFTKFNLEDLKDWKPLFTKNFTQDKYREIAGARLDSVQETIDWKIGQRHEAAEEELKQFVHNIIRGRLENWRSNDHMKMFDNVSLSKKLEGILKRMEAASHHEATFTEDDLHTELDKFLKTNDITGFYINRPFTEIEPIIEEIHNADIHHCGPISDGRDRDLQFAIAVHVKAYPRRVLSLWVAVACCSRKRS